MDNKYQESKEYYVRELCNFPLVYCRECMKYIPISSLLHVTETECWEISERIARDGYFESPTLFNDNYSEERAASFVCGRCRAELYPPVFLNMFEYDYLGIKIDWRSVSDANGNKLLSAAQMPSGFPLVVDIALEEDMNLDHLKILLDALTKAHSCMASEKDGSANNMLF